jgi:hypothetical protein
MRWIFAITFGALAGLAPSLAHASKPRFHDGFYFQAAIGPSYTQMSNQTALGTETLDTRIYGGGVMSSLWFGGTPSPGLAIGGGTFSSTSIAPRGKLKLGSTEFTQNNGADTALGLFIVGPFADWYFNPQRGLHLQLMAGYSLEWVSASGKTSKNNPQGVGFLVGLGYDFWVGHEWSIGFLGRFAYAPLFYEGDGYPTIAPGIVATFTYH